MKAVLCKEYGGPETLVVEEVDELHAGPGQVVISVKACGVNFPDVLLIQNLYQFKPDLPFSPGGEVAGVIAEVGEGVSDRQVGDRVIGSTGWGGMAEQVVAEAVAADTIPDSMAFDTAAGFGMIYGTSYHALKQRADLQPEETLPPRMRSALRFQNTTCWSMSTANTPSWASLMSSNISEGITIPP